MDLFEKVSAKCQLRDREVEIVMVKMKKSGSKTASLTPVRCQSSAQCPRESFCRFVNPLTTRLPVDLAGAPGAVPAKKAAAS